MKNIAIHQLTGALKSLATKTKGLVTETATAFNKKSDLFTAYVKRVTAFDAAEQNKMPPEERKELITTVPQRLKYTLDQLTNLIDVEVQLAEANSRALASFEINGKTFENIPVTSLLVVEDQLKSLLDLVKQAPVQDGGVAWQPDTNAGKNVFVTKYPIIQKKTEKVLVPTQVAPAQSSPDGKQFIPATYQSVSKDVPVADITTTYWTGCISSATKAEWLQNLETALSTVQLARGAANETKVKTDFKLGDNLFGAIFGSLD